jgi:16S rRNA (uracil1498-N3)-methyltransferase
MQLFYHPDISETTTTFSFDKDESRHLIKSLRKKAGDIIQVTNGQGWMFDAEIINEDPKKCALQITKVTKQAIKRFYLHMAVAPTKMNDRYEWFLEKATEIGVDEITPIICDHSERKIIKTERFQKIIQSAMKQSLQYTLPKLNEAIPFSKFINQPNNGQLFIAHCEETQRVPLKRKALADHKVTILIGPEGDFSLKEIDIAKEKGYLPVLLGNTRLRTETAAIAACHTIALINE